MPLFCVELGQLGMGCPSSVALSFPPSNGAGRAGKSALGYLGQGELQLHLQHSLFSLLLATSHALILLAYSAAGDLATFLPASS